MHARTMDNNPAIKLSKRIFYAMQLPTDTVNGSLGRRNHKDCI